MRSLAELTLAMVNVALRTLWDAIDREGKKSDRIQAAQSELAARVKTLEEAP